MRKLTILFPAVLLCVLPATVQLHGSDKLPLIVNAVTDSIYPTPRLYTDHYYKRVLQFENEPAITSEDIVMVGNSLTEGGGDWAERLKMKSIRNRGIIGDKAMGVIDRLHQILPGKPKKLFLLIGINDVSHDLTADSVVALVTKVVDKIRTESPETKLYLQSLLPINESVCTYKTMIGKTELIPEINKKLKAIAKKRDVSFINLFPLFTKNRTPILRKELTRDGLHLTEEGYRIWSKKLKKFL